MLPLGLNDFDEITGTETGNWYAIVPAGGSATFSATTFAGDNVTSQTSAEGVVVQGRFTSITVTDGKVFAYRYPRDHKAHKYSN